MSSQAGNVVTFDRSQAGHCRALLAGVTSVLGVATVAVSAVSVSLGVWRDVSSTPRCRGRRTSWRTWCGRPSILQAGHEEQDFEMARVEPELSTDETAERAP